jgi:hypothetical protein
MKRAARIFFHLAAGVSGVLFVVAVGLWIASYRWGYGLVRNGVSSYRMIAISRAEMSTASLTLPGEVARALLPPGRVMGWTWKSGPAVDIVSNLRKRGDSPVAGFFFERVDEPAGTGFALLLPLPFVAALFAPLPLADVLLIRRRRRRGRRLAAGLCVRCGYDLRASPERCPECGAIPATANST